MTKDSTKFRKAIKESLTPKPDVRSEIEQLFDNKGQTVGYGDYYQTEVLADIVEELLSLMDRVRISELETLESVFMGLPDGCVLKTPNNYQQYYTCVYKDHTKKAILARGDTPSQAVVRLAELLTQLKASNEERKK